MATTSTLRTRLSSTRPSVWPGRLHEERHGCDLLHVALAQESPAAHAHLERVAVVGRHDHERAAQLPRSPQACQELADQVVRIPHLKQVAQVVVNGQVGVVEPGHPVDALDRIVARGTALAPGRQIDPRLVREQRVLEVERRLLSLADRPDPLVKARRPPATGQALEHTRPARARAGADVGRTDSGGGLDLEDPIAEPVHQVEDARLVTAHVRRGPRLGEPAVEDRRDSLEGRVVHRVPVREPGGHRGQLREVRKALGVDLPVGAEQVVRRELVEDQHHDRRAALRLLGGALVADAGAAGQQQGCGQLSCEPVEPSPPHRLPRAPPPCCGPCAEHPPEP